MGHRVDDVYRERFRELLARVSPRRLEFGVELLLQRARVRSESLGVPLARALAELYESTRERVEKRLAVMASCGLASVAPPPAGLADPPRFVCDGSLGGLARWLRAAGYETISVSGGGDVAFEEAHRSGSVLLTSDAHVLERRLIQAGTVPTLLVPTGRPALEQLARVLRERRLRPREPRCMACGGALRPVEKERVRERIPPRTARWKDEYFLCAACGKLFWQGTHWDRIQKRLAGAFAGLPLV